MEYIERIIFLSMGFQIKTLKEELKKLSFILSVGRFIID